MLGFLKSPDLRIGVYGYTQAGKTLFLYNLLRYWQAGRSNSQIQSPATPHQPPANEVVEASPRLDEFMQQVNSQVMERKRPDATIRNWDGLKFTWQRRLSPKEKRRLRISVSDLPGELLDQEAREGFVPDSKLASLVTSCNAFLFFFNPSHQADRLSIEEHKQIELERLRELLEFLREGRVRGFLRYRFGIRPLVIVITCRDKWELDANLTAHVRDWEKEAHTLIKQVWKGAPPEILDRANICEIANPPPSDPQQPVPHAQGRQLQRVIERLDYQRRAWNRARMSLLSVLFVLLLLVVCPFVFIRALAAPDPALKELKEQLRRYGDAADWQKMKTEEEYNQLNGLLRRASIALGAFAANPSQEKDREEIRHLVVKIAGHIDSEMEVAYRNREVTSEQLQKWNLLLRDLRPTEQLGNLRSCQYKFWDMARRYVQDMVCAGTNSKELKENLEKASGLLGGFSVPPGPGELARQVQHCLEFLSRTTEYQLILNARVGYKGTDNQRKGLYHALRFGPGDRTGDKFRLDPEKGAGGIPTGWFSRPKDHPKITPKIELTLTIRVLDDQGKRLYPEVLYWVPDEGDWKNCTVSWDNPYHGPLGRFGFPWLANVLLVRFVSHVFDRPLGRFGFPWLANRGTKFKLNSPDYELQLTVEGSEPPWENLPELLKHCADFRDHTPR